jgi:hypothetical protein
MGPIYPRDRKVKNKELPRFKVTASTKVIQLKPKNI